MLTGLVEQIQSKDKFPTVSDSQSNSSCLEASVKDLPFKVFDPEYIAIATASPHVFYVPSGSHVKNLKDHEAKKNS